MALSQVGFGLKPINKVGSNYNAAQVTEYRGFNAKYGGYNLAFQMPVKVATQTGFTSVRPQYSTTDRITGSFVGCQYVDRNTDKPVFADHVFGSSLPTNNFNYETETASFFITDDPYQLYSIKIDSDMTVSAMNGNYFPNYAGDTAASVNADQKRSTVKLNTNSSASFNSNAIFKFMHVGSSVDDAEFQGSGTGYNSDILSAGSNVVVMINKHRYNAGTGGGTG